MSAEDEEDFSLKNETPIFTRRKQEKSSCVAVTYFSICINLLFLVFTLYHRFLDPATTFSAPSGVKYVNVTVVKEKIIEKIKEIPKIEERIIEKIVKVSDERPIYLYEQKDTDPELEIPMRPDAPRNCNVTLDDPFPACWWTHAYRVIHYRHKNTDGKWKEGRIMEERGGKRELWDKGFATVEDNSSGAKSTVSLKDIREIAAIQALVKIAKILRNQSFNKTCKTFGVGSGWGKHELCDDIPRNCYFQSWGISSDWSFDKAMADTYDCSGDLFDPTRDYNKTIYPGHDLNFYAVGHPLAIVSFAKWEYTSAVESFIQSGKDRLDVLKMDCEGCEYSLAPIVEEKMPEFFHKVGQFNVEIHMPVQWMATDQHVYNLGFLLHLVLESGKTLQSADTSTCGHAEKSGYNNFFIETGWPIYKNGGKHAMDCRSLLFA